MRTSEDTDADADAERSSPPINKVSAYLHCNLWRRESSNCVRPSAKEELMRTRLDRLTQPAHTTCPLFWASAVPHISLPHTAMQARKN